MHLFLFLLRVKLGGVALTVFFIIFVLFIFGISEVTSALCSLQNFAPNIYAVQQDTQSVLMSKFVQHLYQLDMFRTSSVHHQERLVQAVLADFGMWYYCAYYSTRPAVSSSTTRLTTYQSLRIQLVQNAPDDGPMRSETCRANISAE